MTLCIAAASSATQFSSEPQNIRNSILHSIDWSVIQDRRTSVFNFQIVNHVFLGSYIVLNITKDLRP